MTDTLVNSMGTVCGVLQKQLVVSNCPLPMGACTWKHRETGQCCYTVENRPTNVVELAQLVGVKTPTDLEIVQMRNKLLADIKANLK